jgi:hypothetical protein
VTTDRHFFLQKFCGPKSNTKKKDENSKRFVVLKKCQNDKEKKTLPLAFYIVSTDYLFYAIFSPKLFGSYAAPIKTVATLMPPNFACR